MQNVLQEIDAVETKLRRWHTRLTRAGNMITKLDRKRRRLLAQAGLPKEIGHLKPKQLPPPTPKIVEDVIPLPELDAFFQPDQLTIPPELRRADAKPTESLASSINVEEVKRQLDKMIVDPATKRRLDRLDEKRRGRSRFTGSDMPLSGRDALKAIRRK